MFWAKFPFGKYMATLKTKSDPILMLGAFKNPQDCIFIFRVPKICTSQKANKIDFPDTLDKIAKMSTYNALLSESLGDFCWLFHFSKPLCSPPRRRDCHRISWSGSMSKAENSPLPSLLSLFIRFASSLPIPNRKEKCRWCKGMSCPFIGRRTCTRQTNS